MSASTLTSSLLCILAAFAASSACAPAESGTPGLGGKQAAITSVDTTARAAKAPVLAERVWLNSASKVYHCVGSAAYGTTKDGKYISEKDAMAQGNRPARDNICGPTTVWVNTASSVYHCPGSANYGKTAAGKYMTEPEARKANIRPSAGRIC